MILSCVLPSIKPRRDRLILNWASSGGGERPQLQGTDVARPSAFSSIRRPIVKSRRSCSRTAKPAALGQNRPQATRPRPTRAGKSVSGSRAAGRCDPRDRFGCSALQTHHEDSCHRGKSIRSSCAETTARSTERADWSRLLIKNSHSSRRIGSPYIQRATTRRSIGFHMVHSASRRSCGTEANGLLLRQRTYWVCSGLSPSNGAPLCEPNNLFFGWTSPLLGPRFKAEYS